MNSRLQAQHILRMLSYSGYSISAIEDFLREIKSAPISEVMSVLIEARDMELGRYSVEHYNPSTRNIVNVSQHATHSDVAEKVDWMLRKEAGLSTEAAAELLAQQLTYRFPNLEVPNIGRKKSFISWVERLSELFPAREILFNATTIRNRMVHTNNQDWTLK
ncbi:hypothetical protein EJD96_15820 [Herbaspirillum seropedicae]|uniref:hypothetical protein n=1 Tax=Herbaspirillum seropedicae TaxID=964 RepID=UPI00111E11BE|nr:hypothetical protein [Herbaspirillum seropedicae]QDD65522.1 hypothetical protein EJD96_15820 [Herbaspirillum seropedicae]